MVEYSEGANVYFDRAAHSFLRGLILYIFTQEPPERRNLSHLRTLVARGDVDGYKARVKKGEIDPRDPDVTPFDVLLGQMQKCADKL